MRPRQDFQQVLRMRQGEIKPFLPARNANDTAEFEINVQELRGKVKIGKNKSEDNLTGVISTPQKSSYGNEKAISKHIERHLKSKD